MARASRPVQPYPPEFRAEAIRLARSRGKSHRQIAEDLGVTSETLRLWRKQADLDEGKRRQDGFLFLAVILDAWSRRVVGWSMRAHLHTELVLAALEMAVWNRWPEAGVIHHSDHGCQDTSVLFGERCAAAGIRSSMGSVGDCFDNVLVESFFATLECELLAQHRFQTHEEARTAVFDWIERFYNRQRRHSALGYVAPAVYEQTGTTPTPGAA